MEFAPEVEQWRPIVKKHADAAGKGDLVDKYLWIINYESGGNPGAIGDGGVAIGLTQIHSNQSIAGRPMEYELLDPDFNIWYAINHLDFGAWGENNLFEGQPFGALGNHPFPGSEGTAPGNSNPGTPATNVSGSSGGIGVPGWVKDAAGKVWPDAINVPGVGKAVAYSVPGGGIAYLAGETLFDIGGRAIGSVKGGLDAVKTAAVTVGKAFAWLLDPHHWFRLFFVTGGVVVFFAGLYVYVRGDKVTGDVANVGKVAAVA